MKKIILSIFTLALFAGCDAIKPQNGIVKLGSHTWRLSSIEHKAVTAKGVAYLEFDEEEREIEGKAFCNSISAEYERMGDDQITFQEVTSTKMFCDGVMDLESQMISSLKNVRRFEIRNGILYLSDSDKVLLTFKK